MYRLSLIKIKYRKYSSVVRLEMVTSLQAVSENHINKKKHEFSIIFVAPCIS